MGGFAECEAAPHTKQMDGLCNFTDSESQRAVIGGRVDVCYREKGVLKRADAYRRHEAKLLCLTDIRNIAERDTCLRFRLRIPSYET